MTGSGRSLGFALAVLALAIVLLGLAAFAAELGIGDSLRQKLGLAALTLALITGPLAATLTRRHSAGLRRLRNALAGLLSQSGRMLARKAPADLDGDLAALWTDLAKLTERESPELQVARRLAAVIAALPQPVLVVTDQGLVTLANQPAINLLGADRLKPGTSVFDAIDRTSLARQMLQTTAERAYVADLALVDGTVRPARLRLLLDHGGLVIAFEQTTDGGTGLLPPLDLHEPPPPRTPPRSDTPLENLSVMVLDCETTGLNVGFDRVLSIGAVRVQGARLVRDETIDCLVDPGEAIPAASTAIHGITDAMVMAARPIAEVWPEIEPALRDCILVGHNIGFDLTILEIELSRAGIRWQRPAALCTVQLAAALDPDLANLNLEAVAQAYGIVVAGRHTALGDALVTAEVYLHLLSLMQGKGDRTLANAVARAATARRVVREQQAAGW